MLHAAAHVGRRLEEALVGRVGGREQSRLAKLWRLTKIAFDVLPIFRVILSFVALIIALWLIDLGLDVLKYFGVQVEMPDKPWLRMLLRR